MSEPIHRWRTARRVAGAWLAGASLGAVTAAATPAVASGFTTIVTFAGKQTVGQPPGAALGLPAGLTAVGGVLYGTAAWDGVAEDGAIYALKPASGALDVLYTFKGGSDGVNPQGRLLNTGTVLYGTTSGGGSYTCSTGGCGTAYALNLTTGVERVLHAFDGAMDGGQSFTGLINVGGALVGTTSDGGKSGHGTVFSLNAATGAETILHVFGGGADSAGDLVHVGSLVYGATYDAGSVYSLNPTTGAYRTLYTFRGGMDGVAPGAGPISVGGVLYGTTLAGGGYANCTRSGVGEGACGTVYALNPATGAEWVLHAFQGGSDGATPGASLVSLGGLLYGTTRGGGAFGHGTVFSVDPLTGAERVLHSFTGGHDGAGPTTQLVVIGTSLYGTTPWGGASGCSGNGCGTVFAIRP